MDIDSMKSCGKNYKDKPILKQNNCYIYEKTGHTTNNCRYNGFNKDRNTKNRKNIKEIQKPQEKME